MNDNNYWNIDDIIMSEEFVTCKLIIDCPFLSMFNLNKNNIDMQNYLKDEIVQLPISIACPLAELGAVAIQNPSYMSNEYYYLLQADPLITNLSGKNKYFYEKINLLMPYVDIEEDKWKKCLVKTVYLRFLYYFKNSQNVQMINTSIHKHSSNKEMKFFENMVKFNNNIKYFKENYSNNNKVLDERVEAKKIRIKYKKINN